MGDQRRPELIPELTMSAWLRFGEIRRGLRIARAGRVLEVGAGQGAVGGWLSARVVYTGVEPDDASRAVAEARLSENPGATVLADVADADARPYGMVCAFEVLEHIEDDRKALVEWRQRLEPRGWLLMSVPAHADHFGPSDTYVGHFRRYERAQLRALLDAESFDVVRLRSYGAGLGQLLDFTRNAILRRRPSATTVEERSGGSGRLFQPKSRVWAYANYAIALPFRLVQLPFSRTDTGIGYVVLARLRA
jgi:SAM-dependent methyltransferase